MQISAVGFQVLDVPFCEILLVASCVLCFPISILKLLIHVDDFIYCLSFSVVHGVVAVEPPK